MKAFDSTRPSGAHVLLVGVLALALSGAAPEDDAAAAPTPSSAESPATKGAAAASVPSSTDTARSDPKERRAPGAGVPADKKTTGASASGTSAGSSDARSGDTRATDAKRTDAKDDDAKDGDAKDDDAKDDDAKDDDAKDDDAKDDDAKDGDDQPDGQDSDGSAEPIDDPSRISFEEHLGIRRDLTLQGVFTAQRIDFALPRGWVPTADAVLHLTLAHSAALQAERSHLSIEVNGQSVRSIALDTSNEDETDVAVRIPRRLLRDYNNVDLRVVQHHTDACEDPFDPALWTRVSNTSWIELPHRRAPIADGLEAWPYPILDTRGYGPVVLTPIVAGVPDASVTDALGSIAVSLGRLASYRGIQVQPAVTDLAAAEGTALLVGLVRDLPQLTELLGAPVELATGEGLVAVVPNPADPTRPVLVVAGNEAGGLAKAVHALTGQDRQPLLSGRTAVVRTATQGTPPPRTEQPRPFPATDRAELAELGLKDTTVRGRYAPSIAIPLRLEGDALWRAGGGELDLRFAYGAQLDTRLSALEVRLDGITLRSLALDEPNGAQDARLKVTLPEELLTPSSELEVVFHMLPKEYDLCTSWTTDQHLWGTVLATSTITLARDHVAQMPDLSRLRHGLWPYLADDAHPVVVALPGTPDAADWSAGLELVAALARSSAADQPSVRLALGSAALAEGPEHLILLGNPRTNATVNALSPLLSVTDEGAARRLKADAPALLFEAAGAVQSDTIEQVAREDRRSALILRATSAEGLRRVVDAFTDPDRRARLGGNAVTIAEDGTIRLLDVRARTAWGELPLDSRAREVVRERGWLPGVALAVGAGIVVLLVRRIARRGRT